MHSQLVTLGLALIAGASFAQSDRAAITGTVKDPNRVRHTIASFDQTHIVKGYILDELPFRKGKSLMADAGGVLNALGRLDGQQRLPPQQRQSAPDYFDYLVSGIE